MTNMIKKLTAFDAKYPEINWLHWYDPIEFSGKNDDFKITTRFNMLGYDNKNTYKIYIQSQFNEFQYSRFIIDAIIDTFIVLNCNDKTDNKQKIKNNNIICCVVTTDNNDIYQINFTQLVKNKHTVILNIIYDIIYTLHCV